MIRLKEYIKYYKIYVEIKYLFELDNGSNFMIYYSSYCIKDFRFLLI